VASQCVSIVSDGLSDKDSFSIAELSKAFGITPRALRFYEEEGLIAPAREGATRIYSRRDRARVALIVRGKGVGFSLDEIAELLDLYDRNDGGAAQRAVTALRCQEKAEVLRQQKAAIDVMLEQLAVFAAELDGRSV
jgi:DNA-binding transcriptional MerR regulator